jgi:hypothetical protein
MIPQMSFGAIAGAFVTLDLDQRQKPRPSYHFFQPTVRHPVFRKGCPDRWQSRNF